LPTTHLTGRTGLTLRHSWCQSPAGPCDFLLVGRAPDVPQASVRDGHPGSTTVGSPRRQAAPVAQNNPPGRASQARGSSSAWSALGPHDVENRWSSAGTSGQRRRISIAGHRPSTVTTSDSAAARRWVRAPQPPPRRRVVHLRFLTSAQLVARMIGGRLALELQHERGVDLEVAQQEGAFVEPPAPQPAGDFGVALAGVA
jgi:hypothetical protein